MVLPIIFGILILVVVIYVALKILKNVVIVVVVIAGVFFASFLIYGAWPTLQEIPLVGQFIPKLPSTTGEAVAVIKDVYNSIDILAANRDASSRLMVVVSNTGQDDVGNFKVFVDGVEAKIINSPKKLKSGETTTLQTDWTAGYKEVVVQTEQASASYKI